MVGRIDGINTESPEPNYHEDANFLCKSLSFKTAYFARESLTQPKRESGMAWGIWEGDYAAQYIRSLGHFDRSRLPKRRGTLSVHRGPSSRQSERVGPRGYYRPRAKSFLFQYLSRGPLDARWPGIESQPADCQLCPLVIGWMQLQRESSTAVPAQNR